jgi:hypothetical protein
VCVFFLLKRSKNPSTWVASCTVCYVYCAFQNSCVVMQSVRRIDCITPLDGSTWRVWIMTSHTSISRVDNLPTEPVNDVINNGYRFSREPNWGMESSQQGIVCDVTLSWPRRQCRFWRRVTWNVVKMWWVTSWYTGISTGAALWRSDIDWCCRNDDKVKIYFDIWN